MIEGVFLLGETLTVKILIGGSLAILGVAIITIEKTGGQKVISE